ncbi:MAG: cytochrome c maturation protein CcmE [Hyphomonas sp.]|nr:cytochrome c maturation protein CcmE [Hyphomonas sp.]
MRFTGVAPDLFREGQGVVATGTFDEAGTFTAKQLLAKHDENYQPRELKPLEAGG